MRYADVILPLATPPMTFAVNEAMRPGLRTGMRVMVQLGARKFYAGIVSRLHDEPPAYKTIKPIVRIVDEREAATPEQLRPAKARHNNGGGIIEDMDFIDYLYFLVFFTPFTSGPIDRSRRFTEDANRIYSRSEYADLLARGILLILVGAVYQKVLGTVFYHYFTPAPLGDGPWWRELAGQVKDAYMYGFYLFFDFAGYSLMAMGASYCFGIKTPRNFRAPFLAKDVREFWDRWHMTLSTWLRDFVFMRVVKSATRRKLFKDRLHTACAGYMANFMLMGAWHGLTVDYLVYGAYYGTLMGATDVYQKKSAFHKKHKKKTWYKALQWFVTINLVMLGMAIFSGQLHTVIGGLIHG